MFYALPLGIFSIAPKNFKITRELHTLMKSVREYSNKPRGNQRVEKNKL